MEQSSISKSQLSDLKPQSLGSFIKKRKSIMLVSQRGRYSFDSSNREALGKLGDTMHILDVATRGLDLALNLGSDLRFGSIP